MNAGELSGVMTILAFAAFLGVVFWAFGKQRKADFDAAARLPLEDDLPVLPVLKADKSEDSSS